MRWSLIFLVIVSTANPALASPDTNWRDTENDGRNVLYCLLKVQKVLCTYDSVSSAFVGGGNGRVSAQDIATVAATFGRPVSVMRLSFQELVICHKPLIVHTDGEIPDAGGFLLVFGIDNSDVVYISGTGAIGAISRDAFRRVWSGFALVPQEPVLMRYPFLIGLVGVLGVGACLAIIILALRPRTTGKVAGR